MEKVFFNVAMTETCWTTWSKVVERRRL